LTYLDAATGAAVLAYLNLPPVGALADRDGPPALESNDGMEMDASLRRVLLARRGKTGCFRSLADLTGIPGFGPKELYDIAARLGDLERYGNRARPVWGGPEGERALFSLLEGATRYIHISTLMIGGDTGLGLAELLARKKRQGLDVRVMFCATGFIISGTPSGTGFVSRFSELRSHAFNDMYRRRRIIRRLRESGVGFINNVPIGHHWRRRDLRAKGVDSAAAYYRWSRARGLGDDWIEQQALIDEHRGPAFSNVDHRKMVIVDGDRALVGSQNLADSYLYSNPLSADPKVNVRNWQWLDNSTILDGPCVQALGRLFAERWMLAGGDMFDVTDARYSPAPTRAGHAVVTLDKSIPGMMRVPFGRNLRRLSTAAPGTFRRLHREGENPIRNRLRQLPELAKNDFYAEHCYPTDAELLENWTAVARRLDDFFMVVPRHYDTKILGLECDRTYPAMIDAGARLFGYDRAILHSKIAVVDGWYVATGSYNLTLRSARSDLENEVFVQCPENGAAVRDRIRDDLQYSTEVTPGLSARYRARRSLPFLDAVVRYLIL
jgi:cardiolipin synthase